MKENFEVKGYESLEHSRLSTTTVGTYQGYDLPKKKSVSFGKVEVIRVEKYKNYNKLRPKLVIEEEEENTGECKCVVF